MKIIEVSVPATFFFLVQVADDAQNEEIREAGLTRLRENIDFNLSSRLEADLPYFDREGGGEIHVDDGSSLPDPIQIISIHEELQPEDLAAGILPQSAATTAGRQPCTTLSALHFCRQDIINAVETEFGGEIPAEAESRIIEMIITELEGEDSAEAVGTVVRERLRRMARGLYESRKEFKGRSR